MTNRRTELDSSSTQGEEMHCLCKMCPWCVCIILYEGLIFFVWLEMNEADSSQLRDYKVVSIAVLVRRSFWWTWRGAERLPVSAGSGESRWHAFGHAREKEKSPQWKDQGECTLFQPMSKSMYFESLHLISLTAENQEAWTHYVST